MVVLATNSNPGYTSMTVLYNKRRYKISCENGNCYSHLRVEVYGPTGLAQIANEYDIQGYERVGYYCNNDERIKGQERNIRVAMEYIKLIF